MDSLPNPKFVSPDSFLILKIYNTMTYGPFFGEALPSDASVIFKPTSTQQPRIKEEQSFIYVYFFLQNWGRHNLKIQIVVMFRNEVNNNVQKCGLWDSGRYIGKIIMFKNGQNSEDYGTEGSVIAIRPCKYHGPKIR